MIIVALHICFIKSLIGVYGFFAFPNLNKIQGHKEVKHFSKTAINSKISVFT
jgi:hypothetical protein